MPTLGLGLGFVGRGARASVPFTPLSLSNLSLWLDAADATTITHAGGNVSQWRDKSGNAHHATQSTGTAQPQTGVASINGRNALRGDGVNDTLLLPSALFGLSNGNATSFAVYANRSTGFGSVLGATDGGSNRFRIMQSSQTVLLFTHGNASSFSQVSTPADASARLAVMTGNGASMTGRLHDGTVGGVAVKNNFTATSFALFSRGGATEFANADIAEIVLYGRALSASETNQVGMYLAQKWGLTWVTL